MFFWGVFFFAGIVLMLRVLPVPLICAVNSYLSFCLSIKNLRRRLQSQIPKLLYWIILLWLAFISSLSWFCLTCPKKLINYNFHFALRSNFNNQTRGQTSFRFVVVSYPYISSIQAFVCVLEPYFFKCSLLLLKKI